MRSSFDYGSESKKIPSSPPQLKLRQVKKRTKSSSPVKMQNCNSKFKFFSALDKFVLLYEKEIAEIYKEIYSSGESSDSSGSFQFEETRRINQRALSKNF
ncbi:MAG: hypothetical protein COW72_02910 [Candidatus Nealsonbacteria bacterium CG18_big_fil_WC_8_21_14_2_50_37_10]|uniref:Uncharacterized protein n=2 Tax=Patescibacteria group TaxID=1783273 RepID=A0A2H0FF09_9BACT|nr:MAG: hypothetical protein COW72_02910 [Candidatus Nealsonbacteria bacterium CG18_big_fil_WC_8_21_14_2_50_37_10]